MTDDEIRKKAEAAGFWSGSAELWWEHSIPKFRKLIEGCAKECAKVCDDLEAPDFGIRETSAYEIATTDCSAAILRCFNQALPSGEKGRPTVKEPTMAKKQPAKPAKMPVAPKGNEYTAQA